MSSIKPENLRVLQINTRKIIEELTPNLRKTNVIQENESIFISEDAVYKYLAHFKSPYGLPGIIQQKSLLISEDAMFQVSEKCVIGDKNEYFTLNIVVNSRNEEEKTTTHNVSNFYYLVKCDLLISDYCYPIDKTLVEFMGDRYGYNSRINTNTEGLIKFIKKTTSKPCQK